MPEQLVFALAEPGPPTFASFVAGPNAEVVATLAAAAAGGSRDGIVIWGGAGVGRTHLLQAAVAAALQAGRRAVYCATPGPATWPEADLVAIDDVDRADADAQARLFTLFNALRDAGGTFIAAASSPPARMAVRDDLRTRLGWGLALEVQPLPDAHKPAALATYARERGLHLPDDVIAYLLTHARRDMAALVATLAALDRYSLARKRPVTLPLVRDWMVSTRVPTPPL